MTDYTLNSSAMTAGAGQTLQSGAGQQFQSDAVKTGESGAVQALQSGKHDYMKGGVVDLSGACSLGDKILIKVKDLMILL